MKGIQFKAVRYRFFHWQSWSRSARLRKGIAKCLLHTESWAMLTLQKWKCLSSRSLQSGGETDTHRLQQEDLHSGDLEPLVRALEGTLSEPGETSWGPDVSCKEDEELGTVRGPRVCEPSAHPGDEWSVSHVLLQFVKLGVRTTEVQPGNRSGSAW